MAQPGRSFPIRPHLAPPIIGPPATNPPVTTAVTMVTPIATARRHGVSGSVMVAGALLAPPPPNVPPALPTLAPYVWILSRPGRLRNTAPDPHVPWPVNFVGAKPFHPAIVITQGIQRAKLRPVTKTRIGEPIVATAPHITPVAQGTYVTQAVKRSRMLRGPQPQIQTVGPIVGAKVTPQAFIVSVGTYVKQAVKRTTFRRTTPAPHLPPRIRPTHMTPVTGTAALDAIFDKRTIVADYLTDTPEINSAIFDRAVTVDQPYDL